MERPPDMDTEQLIEALAKHGQHVCPTQNVSKSLICWLATALPASSVIIMMMGLRPDLFEKLTEPQFLIQEAAALATAIFAASAALYASIPGQPSWKLVLPLAPFFVWMFSLGRQCWNEWLEAGWFGMEYQSDAMCIPAIMMAGLVPALSLYFLIRKGVVLSSPIALALAFLAASALGDATLRLFHPTDAALMLIVWQWGTVVTLTGIGALAGRHISHSFWGQP